MIRVSCFSNLRNAKGTVEELESLRLIVEKPHEYVMAKDGVGLFSPATFAGNYRSNKNAELVHFGVVEFDHLDAVAVDAVLTHVKSLGCAFGWYTTFNHNPQAGDNRLRVLVPFPRPVPATHWTATYWPRLAQALSPSSVRANADPQCKDPARFYYVPSCPPERGAFAESQWVDGPPLDLEAMGPMPDGGAADAVAAALGGLGGGASSTFGGGGVTAAQRASLTYHLTRDEAQDYLRKLRKRTGACAVGATECLKAVLKGDAWGDKDSRNERLSNLCYELMKDFPTLNPASVSKLFETSCTVIQKQDAEAKKYTPAYVEAKLLEKIKYVEIRQQEYHAKADAEYTKKLDYYGYSAPYTSEEFAQLQEMQVHPRGWIMQSDAGAWIYTGRYGYIHYKGVGNAKNAAAQNLLLAKPYGVRTERVEKDGSYKTMPLDELVQLYGAVPDRVQGSLIEQVTRWSRETGTFTIAECPLRHLEPEADPRIAEWLRLLGGARHEELLQWMAWATYLHHPCVMLVFSGHSGVGKTLFANGMAQLWTEKGEATPLAEAFESFNARIARVPLLFADEKIPKDRDGKHRFHDLRELVTKRSFVINEKNMPRRDVFGSMRIIVAVNSLSLLVGETPESQSELDATLERILHITPAPETVDFLAELRAQGAQWHPDAIARHALHLRELYPLPEKAPRFLFERRAQAELATAFVSQSGLFGAIGQWLISFLRDPRKLYQGLTNAYDSAWQMKVSKKGFFASPAAVQQHWLVYGDRRPFSKSIQSAWVGFALKRTTIDGPSGKRHVDSVNLETLARWAEEHAIADASEIQQLMDAYVEQDVYGHAVTALKHQQELAADLRRPAFGRA